MMSLYMISMMTMLRLLRKRCPLALLIYIKMMLWRMLMWFLKTLS